MKLKATKNVQDQKSTESLNLGLVLWVKKRRIPPQNIVIRLFERSIIRNYKTHSQSYRNFYQIVTPNFTVFNVKKPCCYIRKFSPCGRFLIVFSADQTSVEIYEYKGAAAANDLLHNSPIQQGQTVLHSNEPAVNHVLNNIFDRFFKLRHSVHVTNNQEQLNRECSLFTSDGKHVIVASASSRDAVGSSRLADAYRNNESVTPNPRSPLDDYTVHVIELESGLPCDTVSYKHDKIYLSHNQGLSLYGSTLVVLSVQHQTLHRYHVTQHGKLIAVQAIGRVCYHDDDVLLNSCVAHNCPQLQQQQGRGAEGSAGLGGRGGGGGGGGDEVFGVGGSDGASGRAEDEEDNDNEDDQHEFPSRRRPPAPSSSFSSFLPTVQRSQAYSLTSRQPYSTASSLSGHNPASSVRVASTSTSSSSSSSLSDSTYQHSSVFHNSLFSLSTAWRPVAASLHHNPASASVGSNVGVPSSSWSRRSVLPSPSPAARTAMAASPTHDHLEGPNVIYSLKHRLLVFLYRLSRRQSEILGTPEPTRQFCAVFDTFLNLRIMKMQLLDDVHLLIKYGSEDMATLRSSEPGIQPCYLVVYNMTTTEIIAVYESSSKELMELFEHYVDVFRNARLPCEPRHLCSMANNLYARQVHERNKASLASTCGGSVAEARKRLLSQLPVACQAFSPSPYLDLALFHYQDKSVSLMERPKTASDHPIRFYGRDSGLLKFSLEAGGRLLLPSSPPPSILHHRRLVAFTFHPSDPFTISVQKHMDDYVVSFHVRHNPL